MLISRLEPNTAAETELHRLVLPFLRCTFAYSNVGATSGWRGGQKVCQKDGEGILRSVGAPSEEHSGPRVAASSSLLSPLSSLSGWRCFSRTSFATFVRFAFA